MGIKSVKLKLLENRKKSKKKRLLSALNYLDSRFTLFIVQLKRFEKQKKLVPGKNVPFQRIATQNRIVN
jgi:hypothetical protein